MESFVVGSLRFLLGLGYWVIVATNMMAGGAVMYAINKKWLFTGIVCGGVFGLVAASMATGFVYLLMAQLREANAMNAKLTKIIRQLEPKAASDAGLGG